jgi:hypothetical protein
MKQTEDDKRICTRMKEIRELIKEFGLTLCGYDPGISAYVDDCPNLRASGWSGPFKLDDVEWTWLEPLLKELRDRRRGVDPERRLEQLAADLGGVHRVDDLGDDRNAGDAAESAGIRK